MTRLQDPRPDDDEDEDLLAGYEDDGPEPELGDGADPSLRDRLLRRNRGPRRRRLSEILTEIGADPSRPRISVDDLLQAMSGRAVGAMLLLFAGPNVLPTPPGTSSILGLPLVYLSAQFMLGHVPRLPKFIGERSLYRADFISMIDRAAPVLTRAERLLKPRLTFMVSPRMERVIGAFCLLLSVILLLPVPLGNMLPALAICLFAFGVLERDGVWVIGGFLASAVALVVVWGVVWALAKTAIYLIVNAF